MDGQDEKASEATKVNLDVVNRTPTSEPDLNTKNADSSKGRLRRVYDRLAYVPPRCRYDPENPFKFSMGLNILFGTKRAYQVSKSSH